MAIQKSKELHALLGKPEDVKLGKNSEMLNSLRHVSFALLENGGTTLHSPVYSLLPADLRLPPLREHGHSIDTRHVWIYGTTVPGSPYSTSI